MKFCPKCKESKPFSDFSPDKRVPSGLQSHCKTCRRPKSKEWADKNRDLKRSMDRAYIALNKDDNRARAKLWADTNKERNRKRSSEWKKKNPHLVNAQISKRHASKLRATPPWLSSEHLDQIILFYELAHKYTADKNEKHVVDHIVPLQGKDVCGLHVPWNLQVLTHLENCKKGNKL